MKYKDLDAWKRSMDLVDEVYKAIKIFPREEMYALSSQIRRSAVSIPSNIAEGMGRNHKKEKIQFLHISRGSLFELETQLTIALRAHYIKLGDMDAFSTAIENCGKMLNGLINYYEKNLDIR